MKDELFQQLAASLEEGGAILHGKKNQRVKPRSQSINAPGVQVPKT